MNMNMTNVAKSLITIAILMQLYQLRTNKNISSNAFFIYAFASYMMTYNYYMEDNKQYSERAIIKIFNSTMLLLIAIISR